MNIYYNDNTLYVTLEELINNNNLKTLKSRVFNILNDYDIDNIVLNLISNKDNYLLDEFISEYNKKYHGKLIIK